MDHIDTEILNALLIARVPITRSDLAGRVGISIKRLAPHLDRLVAEGVVVQLIERTSSLDSGLAIGIQQRLYRLSGPRIVTHRPS